MPRTGVDPVSVDTWLRLPTGIFYKSGVKANVLFFDKHALRADGKPNTKELQFHQPQFHAREEAAEGRAKPLPPARLPARVLGVAWQHRARLEHFGAALRRRGGRRPQKIHPPHSRAGARSSRGFPLSRMVSQPRLHIIFCAPAEVAAFAHFCACRVF